MYVQKKKIINIFYNIFHGLKKIFYNIFIHINFTNSLLKILREKSKYSHNPIPPGRAGCAGQGRLAVQLRLLSGLRRAARPLHLHSEFKDVRQIRASFCSCCYVQPTSVVKDSAIAGLTHTAVAADYKNYKTIDI